MTSDDHAEAARRSLLDTIARVLRDDDPPTADQPRSKIPPSPKAPPTPKPPPALRSGPRTNRPTGEPIERRPLIEEGGGPISYVPPADGLLGGTERRRSK
jgi:hypothetical protein